VINNAFFELKKNPETEKLELVPRPEVPKSLIEKWKEIKSHPEDHIIWTTFAKRRWRWQGQKGRWIYFYHFFPHDEMTLRFGRHKVWCVNLLPTPIGFHAPSKVEWIKMRMQEMKKEELTPTLKTALEKEYKREVKGQKWLLVMLHPTVTLTGEAEVFERLEGFQSLLPIIAQTMRTLGTKLAKYDALIASVKGFTGYQLEAKRTIEELTDELGRTSTLVQNLQRSLKEKRIPVVISPEASPMPFAPQPRIQEKPSKIKQALLGEFNWVYATILLGFAMAFFGLLQYATNPANWGLLGFGSILFMFGVFMWWREKRSKLPFIEETKEKIKETKESLMEEGA
jgi:hypothetical protein